ncbi:NTP transferase domain-containing protein [Thermosulfurimonas marina]|uniref:NTP transferase domain-containing protein n=1 Tax=Thermosulfurimonas marina TaxID=2047767 RepID=A0A6H1WU38_9BACT|nr:sugar phosphate nucleotidyltransferase [Thermosulfurimonas marina]QJA06723.1 NTP transferase domain-containing protein [Thermosulfurimonas marina]
MRAFVLCAGRGERLRPLTDHLPKPLLHLKGRPFLEITLARLLEEGFTTVGLNTWHLRNEILAFAEGFSATHPEITLEVFEEPELLGTCGALRYAAAFFTEPTLVINGDILTNFPLRVVYEAFLRRGGPCLMFCHRRPGLNRIRIQEERVVGFGEDHPEGFAYTGIQVVSPEWVAALPEERDLVPAYQKLIQKGLLPQALVATGFYWRDLGTPESFRELLSEIRKGKHPFL